MSVFHNKKTTIAMLKYKTFSNEIEMGKYYAPASTDFDQIFLFDNKRGNYDYNDYESIKAIGITKDEINAFMDELSKVKNFDMFQVNKTYRTQIAIGTIVTILVLFI